MIRTTPRGSDSPHSPSRREGLWALIRALAKLGFSAEVIAGLILNPDYGISDSILEKPNPAEYAYRQAEKAIATVTDDWPEVYSTGGPKKSFLNALYGLYRMGITFENDAFHNRKRIGGHQLQSFQGDLTDDDCAMLRKAFVDKFGFDPGKGHLLDAVQVLCIENTHHPVRDYLASLKWDGISRLETWFIDYLEAEDTDLNRAIGKIMLVAAMRRVMQPGCKFDIMVVFEGSQGSGKSTALLGLAGEENFSDQHLLSLDAMAQMEAFEGVWIFEIAELSGMRGAEIEIIKGFIIRTENRERPA